MHVGGSVSCHCDPPQVEKQSRITIKRVLPSIGGQASQTPRNDSRMFSNAKV